MFLLSRFKKYSLLLILLSSSAQAASSSFSKDGFLITVEPILGYELTAVNTPTIHTRAMVIYGGRVTAGHKLIAGEAEYTVGNTNESFPAQDESLTTNKQNVRLGLRSSMALTHWMDFIFRGGGQASKTKIDTTTISTATSVTSAPNWEIHPYAGAGISGHVADALSLSLEATYLFRSVTDFSQNDVQASFSVKFHLSSR